MFSRPQPSEIISLFSDLRSMISNSGGTQFRRFNTTFRRKLSMVLPHRAKRSPLNVAMLHRIKPTVMHTVLPDLMEPSHTRASRPRKRGCCHQSIASIWRLLNFV